MNYFITGIGTDVGKTVIASILVEALHADYWKPVQCGDLENSDTTRVKQLTSNTESQFHPETYRFTQPLSPHAAAKIDGVKIEADDFKLPKTNNHLIIEGAGGLMVPLNENRLIIDLIKSLFMPVILVSRNYLGSINHTLLSVEILKHRNIPIAGIIFNGVENIESESIIKQFSGLYIFGRVDEEPVINSEVIKKYSGQFSFLGK